MQAEAANLIQTHPRRPGRPRKPNFLGRSFDARIAMILRLTNGRPGTRLVAWEAAREAVRELLPREQRRGRGVSPSMLEQIQERAMDLLRRYELAGDEDQTDVEKQVRLAVRWAMRTFDPTRASGDFHFDLDDIRAAEGRFASLLTKDQMQARLAELESKGARLDRDQFVFLASIIWVAAAKNALQYAGAVPVASLEGMLNHFVSRTHHLRTIIAVTLGTLEQIGALRCTHRTYGPGFCRKYAVCGASRNIPFIGTHMSDLNRRVEAQLGAAGKDANQASLRTLAEATENLNAIASSPFSNVLGYPTPTPHPHPTPLPDPIWPSAWLNQPHPTIPAIPTWN